MIFCSTIIPTIGRDKLNRAVESVLSQKIQSAEYEVIVVNDSGRALKTASWQTSANVKILETNKHNRCWARNVGAAAAKGEFLHFLDDDDWLLPGALEAFFSVTRETKADWVYGQSQLVGRQNNEKLHVLRHGINGNGFIILMSGEWIPLQASLIRRSAFFAIDGFHPWMLVTQDMDICRRIVLHGEMEEIPQTVCCIEMGTKGSSTDYGRASIYSRHGRELILEMPETFNRLRQSAQQPKWRGRFARIYFTSAVYNLQNRHYITCLERGVSGMMVMAMSAASLVSKDFWHAMTTTYQSEAFAGAPGAPKIS